MLLCLKLLPSKLWVILALDVHGSCFCRELKGVPFFPSSIFLFTSHLGRWLLICILNLHKPAILGTNSCDLWKLPGLSSKIDSLCIAQSDIVSLQRVALANHCRELYACEGMLYSLHEVVDFLHFCVCVCVDLCFHSLSIIHSYTYVKVDWSETVSLHSWHTHDVFFF